jgi:hypothetical protein
MKQHLRNLDNLVIAISIEDIIAQYKKDNIEEQDITALLPLEL